MKKNIRTKFTTAALAMATGATMAPVVPASAATSTTPDGKTSETAAASCYEIKQNNPNSPSGSYWLYTPEMDAPAQFYCDQETDGGGWVLIGRGREGWTEEYAGKGNAQDLANNPDGTDAFTPVQLPSQTIDALLNGRAPNTLASGIRVRRAINTQGTQWQEARMTRNTATKWSWALGATAKWSNFKFVNSDFTIPFTYGSSLDGIASFDAWTHSMLYSGRSSQNWKLGFAYGSLYSGYNNPSSYLWSANNGGGYAVPFSQVFVRPTLKTGDLSFTKVADSGAAGSARRVLPNSYSAPMRWRTSEQTATGQTGEMNSYVQAITQVGNTVFVGGDYAYVESATGERVKQQYLTGYDVNTGELVRTFLPKFNNQIKSLQALPNGKLAVGGEFTQVNGESVPGFAIIDPTTGALDKTWNIKVENRVAGAAPVVKTMDVQGDYLYLGGSFTHTRSTASITPVYARNLVRINVNTGAVDKSWTPNFNGTVNGVSASADGQSVYAAGYFSSVNNESAFRLAALNATNGKRKANWTWDLSFPAFTSVSGFQFDVQDAGSSVFAGGAEHIIAQYDSSTFARKSSAITREGGDFQDLHASGDTIYGACHCGDWVYDGGTKWKSPWDQATDVNQIRLVGAFDKNTGATLPEFNPQIKGAHGYGVWESFVDSNGTLWVGGDINSTVGAKGVQKTVGFARFTTRDVTAPAVPTNLQVTTAGNKDNLTWTPVGNAQYEILRDDRVIAKVDSPSYSANHVDEGRYFVRTIDSAGNYSATTPVTVAGKVTPIDPVKPVEPVKPVDPAAPVIPVDPVTPVEPVAPVAPAVPGPVKTEELFGYGSTWDYLIPSWWTGQTWKDDYTWVTGWQQGKASIGWRSDNLATPLYYWDSSPMALYVRKEVQITDVSSVKKLTLTTYADDGYVVYFNGKEIDRNNMPAGWVWSETAAESTVDTASAKTKEITIEVPVSYLREGRNVIATEVHLKDRFKSDLSFDMSATITR